jgi:imidazoleglycerol-phosphate dehydratase
MSRTTQGVRYAEVDRETGETCVRVVLDLEGGSRRDISTGLAFFDHMLSQVAFHGHIDLGINSEGDLHIDDHHTVEDVGICLGRAIKQALLEDPITRYGSSHTVMDDALVLVAMDISGRGQLYFDGEFKRDRIGDFSTECVQEFFGAVASNAGITLHIRKIAGHNDHHVCEAMFKGFGLVLHQATRMIERRGPSSTKGHIGS